MGQKPVSPSKVIKANERPSSGPQPHAQTQSMGLLMVSECLQKLQTLGGYEGG